MSKYEKIVIRMVDLYQKNIFFVYLFCLIIIGILGLLYTIQIPIIRVILMSCWWLFSFGLMYESLLRYKYKNKKDKNKNTIKDTKTEINS